MYLINIIFKTVMIWKCKRCTMFSCLYSVLSPYTWSCSQTTRVFVPEMIINPRVDVKKHKLPQSVRPRMPWRAIGSTTHPSCLQSPPSAREPTDAEHHSPDKLGECLSAYRWHHLCDITCTTPRVRHNVHDITCTASHVRRHVLDITCQTPTCTSWILFCIIQ